MTSGIGGVQEIVESIKRKYAGLARGDVEDPGFLHGRDLAIELGYGELLDGIPESAIESFAGVGNAVLLGDPKPGERVLDLGSGAGLDSLIAGRLVGESGFVSGIDFTPEMVEKARLALDESGLRNVEFVLGSAESMPFEEESFDLVITNGLINLSLDKRSLLSEVYRVTKPGGRLAACDVILAEELMPQVLADPEAWAC